MKAINADLKRCQIVECNEDSCRWRTSCANHISAGDFRTEDGMTPHLHLEKGVVMCDTIDTESDGVEEYRAWPKGHSGDGCVFVKDLIEKTDNYNI